LPPGKTEEDKKGAGVSIMERGRKESRHKVGREGKKQKGRRRKSRKETQIQKGKGDLLRAQAQDRTSIQPLRIKRTYTARGNMGP